MLRTAIKLFLIFFLVYGGVHIWYGRLTKEFIGGDGQKTAKKISGKAAETAGKDTRKKGNRPPGVTASARPEQPATPAKAAAVRQDFQVIVSRNIFQAALDKVDKKPKPVVQQEVVATGLNLTLLGTVTGDRETARAIIVDNARKQQEIFQIGDAVQGAFIETIERGKVTLDVNGKMEALVMKEREGGGPGPPRVSRSPAANRRKPVPAQSPPTYEEGDREPVARKPPVRPHRRISFRRDPSREEEPLQEEMDMPVEEMEDGLPPLE